MTSDYLFRKFAEHHPLTLSSYESGYYMFCTGIKSCPWCKILDECQQFSNIAKPTINQYELDAFKEEHPEEFI